MIPNGEGRVRSKILVTQAKSEGHEAKSEGQKWHYLAVKKVLAIVKGITSKIMVVFIVELSLFL